MKPPNVTSLSIFLLDSITFSKELRYNQTIQITFGTIDNINEEARAKICNLDFRRLPALGIQMHGEQVPAYAFCSDNYYNDMNTVNKEQNAV